MNLEKKDNLVLQEMLQNKDRFEAGLKILNNKYEVLSAISLHIMGKLEDRILQKAKEYDLDIKNEYKTYLCDIKNSHKSSMGLRVRDKKWKENVWLSLEAQGKWYEANFCYGIWKEQADIETKPHEDFTKILGDNGKESKWWPWWIYIEEREFNLHDPTLLTEACFIKDGENPEFIERIADRFADDLKKLEVLR